jgi:hypothetical protein
MAEALARQQQLKNDATKMAMKTPIFHGSKDDTMDIVEFFRRFEASAEAMNLVGQPEKCNIFSSYLRGNAAKKWKMMAYFREDTRTWATVKAYFMKAYKGEIVPDKITHKITKLQQEKKETINDFEHRCAKEIYDVSSWMKLTKMPHLWHSPQHRKKSLTETPSEKCQICLPKLYFSME